MTNVLILDSILRLVLCMAKGLILVSILKLVLYIVEVVIFGSLLRLANFLYGKSFDFAFSFNTSSLYDNKSFILLVSL